MTSTIHSGPVAHESPSPLSGLQVSLVGLGRVGASLAHWLHQSGAEMKFVAGRRGPDPATLRRLQAAFCPVEELQSGGQDLLVLATPDAALEPLAGLLSRRPQADVVLHVSGSLGADVLEPLGATGCAVGTLHPLRAFVRSSRSVGDARGVFFALDGDAAAVALARRLVAAWQGHGDIVAAADRCLYHFAATLAAGGVATLMSMVDDISRHLGLPSSAGRGYLGLAHGALDQTAAAERPWQAITGPAARGDDETLASQRHHLQEQFPHWLPLFAALTDVTRQQVGRRPEEGVSAAESEDALGPKAQLREDA